MRVYLNSDKVDAIRDALARRAEDLRDLVAEASEDPDRLAYQLHAAQSELEVVEELQASDFPVP